MTPRPLHAVLLPAAAGAQRLLEVLGAALDGTGPALLPVDPRLPAERARALLRALRPATLETLEGTQRLDPGDSPAVAPGTAVVIVTSGSTGEPKGVELSAAALRHSARASLDRIGARPGEAWLSCLPPSHISGLQVFVRSLLSGVPPVVLERLDAESAATTGGGALLARGGGLPEYVSLVPTQVRHLLDEPGGRDALAGFRAILLGGAAVPAGLRAEAAAAGARVITTYGMSETCGGCVYDGEPLDGVSARIGPDGRIRLAGPVLFSAYRGRPDLTAAALEAGWFVTSDVGEVDGSGRLTVRGRADGMINTGGEKVSADEVASVLEDCPGVREAVVVGRPDPEWGELVTAIVVPADPAAPPGLDVLRGFARGRLPDYAAPRAVVVVPAVPLLPSGKPDLRALRLLAQPG
ncbi:MAG: Acyl-CoA synthetase (AMP-forming)/AMP-acid ligase II-like protein [Actinomycetia bacterium]|nr:Acyl-CoA synthetase (AMP-forming)/AMP-acid ligase II-like protein [Actinomycetes bacterium]